MGNSKQLTTKDKLAAISEFILYYLKVKGKGCIQIRVDCINGGISTIRTIVEDTLFPVEVK